jgi:hypothetical protein
MKDPTDDKEVRKGFHSLGSDGFQMALKLNLRMEYSVFKRACVLCSQQLATQQARPVSQIRAFIHTRSKNSFSSASMACTQEKRDACRFLMGKTEEKRPPGRDLGVDGKVTLELIWKK